MSEIETRLIKKFSQFTHMSKISLLPCKTNATQPLFGTRYKLKLPSFKNCKSSTIKNFLLNKLLCKLPSSVVKVNSTNARQQTIMQPS